MRMFACVTTTSIRVRMKIHGQSSSDRNSPKSLPDTRFVRGVPPTGRFIVLGAGAGARLAIDGCSGELNTDAKLESRWTWREIAQIKRVSGSDFGRIFRQIDRYPVVY